MVKATSAIKWFGTARHKSENIAETLKKEIDEIKNESTLVVLVTDSTSNMVKTRDILLEADYMEAVVRAIRGYEDLRDEHAEEDFENNREKLTPTEKLLMKKKTQLSELFDERTKGEKAAEKEIEVYRKLPSCPQDESILAWWKAHAE